MLGVLVQIRELDGVQRRNVGRNRGRGHAGEAQRAGLEHLDSGVLAVSENRAGIHFDLHAAFGALLDEASELLVSQSGRVAFGVRLGELEDDLSTGHRGERKDQHESQRHSKQLFHDGFPPNKLFL